MNAQVCEYLGIFLWLYGCANMYVRLRVPLERITNPDGGVVGTIRQILLHCIRTLRTGFESIRLISNTVSKEISL